MTERPADKGENHPFGCRCGCTFTTPTPAASGGTDDRTELQRALDVIGEAASALEHERPLKWFPSAIAELRAAAPLLKRESKRSDLLDWLNDWAGDCDVLFRRSSSPDSYRDEYAVPDVVKVIEVRQWEREEPPLCNEPWDVAEEALRREANNDRA